MSLVNLSVMYGHLEGAGGDFARDPTGHLSIEVGIFQKHGLDVSWNHVQGTEERYRRLENGSAQISLVVGRASLQHFLTSRTTRILGCAMNSCPYYLMVAPAITKLPDLKNRVVACREGPSRNTPIAETFQKLANLAVDKDLTLQLLKGDQDAFDLLIDGKVDGAFLPRPFGFIAEERGFNRITEWPDVVDDPLPITIETTEKLWRERSNDFRKFLPAHQEGIRYFKTHRDDATRILTKRFGHSESLAKKTCDDYIVCMEESLKVDFKQFEKLLSQVAPDAVGAARQIASEWVMPGALKE
ncbi:MAG TPA: ABC transporter substrate-binding protein [Candidatus Binatia bacterium]|jgi:ABC-type nitrate/sulfonate/bicarbonate transport system substrate-binding protein|nr:ABC transporter substrate-binding protein [Candidatus Binatia bacterium]